MYKVFLIIFGVGSLSGCQSKPSYQEYRSEFDDYLSQIRISEQYLKSKDCVDGYENPRCKIEYTKRRQAIARANALTQDFRSAKARHENENSARLVQVISVVGAVAQTYVDSQTNRSNSISSNTSNTESNRSVDYDCHGDGDRHCHGPGAGHIH